MSDADDIEDIRSRKKEKLLNQAGAVEAPDTPVHVESEAHFRELLSDHGLVLVDFYADWCGPCEMLEPTVEAVAEETQATVAKVDIDTHRGLAQQYQVRGVPTLHLFRDGNPVEQMVGVQDRGTLVQAIETHA